MMRHKVVKGVLSPFSLFCFFHSQYVFAAELLPSGQTHYLCKQPPSQADAGHKKQAVYNLFAAYLHTVPLEELIESVGRARRDAQLKYVVLYGAACSYCLARAERSKENIYHVYTTVAVI